MGWLSDWAGFLPTMLDGLKYSLLLAVVSVGFGYPLGLVLGLLVQSPIKVVRWLSLAFVELGRGAPALVLLYLVYYGLPKVGISFDSLVAASIALTWNASAYASEMFRGALQSVSQGQREAAAALGLGARPTFMRVILPQGLRSATPGLMGLAIQMFQGTSLAYAIAVPELMKSAYTIGSQDFDYLKVFILAGIIYACISVPATWITVFFERRMARRYA